MERQATCAAEPAALEVDPSRKDLQLGGGDRFTPDQLVEGRGQVALLHRARVTRVVDAAVVDDDAVLADDKDLCRPLRIEQPRELRALVVDQPAAKLLLSVERELRVARVLTVRVDVDEVHVFGRVGFFELRQARRRLPRRLRIVSSFTSAAVRLIHSAACQIDRLPREAVLTAHRGRSDLQRYRQSVCQLCPLP